jgi:hypothetical protein
MFCIHLGAAGVSGGVVDERESVKYREFAEVQANLKPLTEEQWEEVQELRPWTPFESKIGRSHTRIRIGEPLSLEDVKDWAIDVLVEAMMRKEEIMQRKICFSVILLRFFLRIFQLRDVVD